MNRKRRMTVWIVAALVTVPSLYLLSFGPACWVTSQNRLGASALVPALPTAYQPILALWNVSPAARDTFAWYAGLGSPRGWGWVLALRGAETLDYRKATWGSYVVPPLPMQTNPDDVGNWMGRPLPP